MTCEIEVGASRHRGIVLDLSPRGLFVQSDSGPALGTPVRVHLRGAEGTTLVVVAEVARKRVVPRRLASVAAGGLGLRIKSAPEEYFQLLEGNRATRRPDAPSPAPPTTATRESLFRVRVQQCGGPRSRNLLVSAESEEDARKRADDDLGEDWKVLDVVPA